MSSSSSKRKLRAARFLVQGQEVAVLSYDINTAQIPENVSKAEQAVLLGILAGKSNAEIAKARGTSVRTVANQVAQLLRKFDVASRVELLAAMNLGRGKR